MNKDHSCETKPKLENKNHKLFSIPILRILVLWYLYLPDKYKIRNVYLYSLQTHLLLFGLSTITNSYIFAVSCGGHFYAVFNFQDLCHK